MQYVHLFWSFSFYHPFFHSKYENFQVDNLRIRKYFVGRPQTVLNEFNSFFILVGYRQCSMHSTLFSCNYWNQIRIKPTMYAELCLNGWAGCQITSYPREEKKTAWKVGFPLEWCQFETISSINPHLNILHFSSLGMKSNLSLFTVYLY